MKRSWFFREAVLNTRGDVIGTPLQSGERVPHFTVATLAGDPVAYRISGSAASGWRPTGARAARRRLSRGGCIWRRGRVGLSGDRTRLR